MTIILHWFQVYILKPKEFRDKCRFPFNTGSFLEIFTVFMKEWIVMKFELQDRGPLLYVATVYTNAVNINENFDKFHYINSRSKNKLI
jgi:hypothetical protein